MSLFRTKKKPIGATLSKQEAFRAIPLKNKAVREESLGQKTILTYPLQVSPWVARIAAQFGRNAEMIFPKKLELDEMGTAVWQRIDNQSTVRDIVRSFAEEYRLEFIEAETSVTLFLRELGRRGIIGMM